MGLSITPFVAEIERFIISQGKYEEFKDEFKKYLWTTLGRDEMVFNSFKTNLAKHILMYLENNRRSKRSN